MGEKPNIPQRFVRILFFFPLQLLFLHLKRNYFMLVCWLLLFGMATQDIGSKFGLPYLLLYPEYLGSVNGWSHLILGFSCGGFIMAFNMYSYVSFGYRFSFIATVSRPFYKFSINNFIIPLLFVSLYVWKAIEFQYYKELVPADQIALHIAGFLTGMFLFFFFSMLYFFKTNKDLFRFMGKSEADSDREFFEKGITLHKRIKWSEIFKYDEGWRVVTYLNSPFRIRLARDSMHYDKDLLKKVLAQNRINTSIFEFAMIMSFLLLGSLGEYPFFMIPAGASIFLLLTMIIMLVSAISSWLRGWTIPFMIVGFLLLNYISQHSELFSYRNFAYGLDYKDSGQADYSPAHIHQMQHDEARHREDMKITLSTLDRWKLKNRENIPATQRKPKMVIVCASGGGLRSALWTFHVLQQTDKELNGRMRPLTHMITGASGGMMGAAYFRELMLQQQQGQPVDIYDSIYREKIAQDILNPVAFSIATNDFFIRWRRFSDGPYYYTIDRGYMFEKHLHANLDSALARRMHEYTAPEQLSDIPLMLFTPTIINDSRRLIVASQPLSFLTGNTEKTNVNYLPAEEYVEFNRLFEKQNASNMRFASAVRMSASFPYVMPMVSLPSEPVIEVMDAGYRDNYGIRMALRYIFSLRKWISTHTSGVVLVEIRDRQKAINVFTRNNSLVKGLTKPLGNVYENIFYTQDFENDQLLQNASGWLETPLDVVSFCLVQNEKERVSLSWHLTQLEKQQVISSLYRLESNQMALKRLKELLE